MLVEAKTFNLVYNAVQSRVVGEDGSAHLESHRSGGAVLGPEVLSTGSR